MVTMAQTLTGESSLQIPEFLGSRHAILTINQETTLLVVIQDFVAAFGSLMNPEGSLF
jgi:hypothetical protein